MTQIDSGTLDYKILLQFLFIEGGIRPGQLKKKLNAKHSTINSALKRLEEEGYIEWELYGEVNVTAEGRQFLTHVETHHHLIEVFLVESLGLTLEHAKKEALHLSSHFSCQTIRKICDKYDNPKMCPNNRQIPHHELCHKHEGENLTYITKI